MLWRAAALMAITFCMTGSRWRRLCGVSLGKTLISQRFGTSARKGKNGFMPERIVSSQAPRRNIQGKNVNYFNEAKTGGLQRRGSCQPRPACGRGSGSSLVPRRRKQIAAAPDGADHGRLGRVRLDLAADPHDSEIDGAVESFGVACIG